MRDRRYIHPIPADEMYCHYCGKQYKTLWSFKRHVIARHGLGLAARLGLLTDEEEAALQRIEATLQQIVAES